MANCDTTELELSLTDFSIDAVLLLVARMFGAIEVTGTVG